MDWYYVSDGERKGPVDDQALEGLAAQGVIADDTLVWHEGLADWVPYAQTKSPAPAAAAPVPVGETVAPDQACSECGRTFPTAQMIHYGTSWVCAECKPVFLQRLREGADLAGEFQYGGFWIRFVAKFVDGIILWVGNSLIEAAIGGAIIGGAASLGPDKAPGAVVAATVVNSLIGVAVGATYTTFFVGKFAATPGKMACGLKIVRSDGSRVSYARALGRHFAEMLSSIILAIGYIMAAFDSEKRTLHDRICDTRVVHR